MVGGEEIEDEANEGLIPNHGEEDVHQTDRHDLLFPPSAFVLLVAKEDLATDLPSSPSKD